MSVSMEGGESVVGGEHKTIVPMSRAFLPLPLTEHAVLLAIATAIPVLASRLDSISGMNNVLLVMIAVIYLSLRIHRAQKRYAKAPKIEISAREIILPHLSNDSRLERAIPTEDLRSIEFTKGVGSLKKIDTSVVFTDDQGRQFRVSGFNANLLLLREALEKYELSYTRRRNPKQFVHWAVLAVAIAGGLYLVS